ncbi:MAG TPA: hypothetical protein VFX59_16800, partial [Polyangiales bacterium]|nr:hypothetical protein [Polyangiales bacterium]
MSWGLTALLALALAGCGDETKPATALAVSVKHDLGSELTGLRVRLYQASADFHNPKTPLASETVIPAADLAKPIVVTKGGADEALVVVRGLNAQNAEIVEYAVRARFQDGKTIRVPVFLGAACKAKACTGTADTCHAEGAS